MPSTSGKYLKAYINTTLLIPGLQEWEVNQMGDVLDATTAESNGFGDTDIGVQELEITIRGLHKLTNGPFPTLSTGVVLSNVVLWTNSTNANPDYILPAAIVTRATHNDRIRGQIAYTITVKTKGTYTIYNT